MSNTENVRADRLNLGDTVLFPCVVRDNGLVTELFVTSLDLVGDDVEINATVTTSQNNLVTRLKRDWQ